jgi:hypothetical protein
MRLIPQNTLVNLGLKKYGQEWLGLVSKIQISTLSFLIGKKLEFFKIFNIFVILAYELHNIILIMEKFDDFFF